MVVVRLGPLVIGPATTTGGVATESATPPRARHGSSLPHGGGKKLTTAAEFQEVSEAGGVPQYFTAPLLPLGLA